MTDLTGNIFIEGPAGKLEGLLKEPDGAITRAAIVCHPHPLFGGTMHNKVVYRIAKALEGAGFAVLRFNFRGAGRSQGNHANGVGEQDDLRAAIQFIEGRYPDAELWVAGFSFGASVVLRAACEDDRIHGLVVAGTPVSTQDFSDVKVCAKPKLFVQGARDQFGAVTDLEQWIATLSEPKVLRVIEGAGHFFEGRLEELSQAVSGFIQSV